MHFRFGNFCGCKNKVIRELPAAGGSASPPQSSSFSIREEYASAFRTESYTNFFSHVLDLTLAHGALLRPHHSSAAVPSFRLLAEDLLDPNQHTASRLLSLALTRRLHRQSTFSLLSDYFALTADASMLCFLLLKELDQLRHQYYRPLLSTVRSLLSSSESVPLPLSFSCPSHFPFPSLSRLDSTQTSSAALLSRLDLRRAKTRTSLRHMKLTKRALAIVLVAVAASTPVLGIHIAVHALVAAIAVPALPSARRLRGVLAQMDAAAKGTYILNRDLDTISRLVARVGDEVEHTAGLLRLCSEGKGDVGRRMAVEMARQIWRNDEGFRQQLDELEEHLYLRFLTINKGRNLVMKLLGD